MKVLTQNKQTIINLEQAFRVSIEGENKKSKIIVTSATGEVKILGFYTHREVQDVFNQLIASTDETFTMPLSEIQSGGRNLKFGEIKAICSNFKIAKHAADRMFERGLLEAYTSEVEMHQIVQSYIENNYRAFWNEDGTANIAIDDDSYFVIKYLYGPYNCYVVMTYCNKSKSGITVTEKQKLAKQNYQKRIKKEESYEKF